jgi:integrase
MARPLTRTSRTRPHAPATSIDQLLPNAKNPRKPWDAEQLKSFRDSLVKFGDLGGIVRNVTTNQLIGGHKRIEAFRAATSVKVTATPQPPDPQGTIAHGYVLVDGARFAYREVRWSEADEIAANLAANRWGAEWDWQLVSDALKAIGDDDLLAMTGFRPDELSNLMAADWTVAAKGDLMGADDESHVVHLSPPQYALLTDAKAKIDPTAAISDAAAIERLCRDVLAAADDSTGVQSGNTRTTDAHAKHADARRTRHRARRG